MYFNVPQSRQRMIFVGVREDLGIEPSHPEAESVPVTVGEAFVNCNKGLSDGFFTGKKLQLAAQILRGGDGSDVIKGTSFNLKKLDDNKPSRTILKSVGKPDSSFGGGLIHPFENRHVNIAELQRINSFPDEYKFIGKFQEQWMRIGNSVPPLFARSWALHVKNNILNRIPSSPR